MPTEDLQHRFLFDDCDIRGELVTLSASYREALQHNQYPPAVRRLLGEFFAAVGILSSTLKFEGRIILQARGDGALATIMAECTNTNDLRGIARLNPGVEINDQLANHGGLHELLGEGVLVISIEPSGQQRFERYQGIVPLDAPNLAGCLEHYFTQSEQLATRLWFAANDDFASGLLIQALPQQLTDAATNQENWETVTTLADTIKDDELLHLDHQSILYRLFHEQNVRVYDPKPLRFRCSCSRERTADALISLGKEEIESILHEQGEINIDCHFCNQHYKFSSDEARSLFGGSTLH